MLKAADRAVCPKFSKPFRGTFHPWIWIVGENGGAHVVGVRDTPEGKVKPTQTSQIIGEFVEASTQMHFVETANSVYEVAGSPNMEALKKEMMAAKTKGRTYHG